MNILTSIGHDEESFNDLVEEHILTHGQSAQATHDAVEKMNFNGSLRSKHKFRK